MYLFGACAVEFFACAAKFVIEYRGPDQIAAATRDTEGE
jgi:hypothetical protein